MTHTVSPAPYGVPGLEFGNTTEAPYKPGRPHGGQDHQWRYADVARSRETFASVTGQVTAAYNDGGDHNGWGNYVDIDVPTLDGTSVHARLAHHETGTVQVRIGDWVTAGVSRIGVMGDTGDAGGIHLHEELWINGRRVDPIYYRTHDIPGTPATAGDNARPFNPTIPILEEDDMITIHAPNRGVALIGPGYFKSLTPEEAENSGAIVTKQIDGNDRQFDLWRQMALGGSLAGHLPGAGPTD